MITRRHFLAATAATTLLAPTIRRSDAATTLDLSTVWPEANFHVRNLKTYSDAVAKASGGAVKINVHAGGALGFKGPEQLRAVRDGLIPMADVLTGQQVGDVPIMGMTNTAFLITSPEELKTLLKHFRPTLDKIAADYNQKILYIVPWPTQYLHLKVKVDTMAGLKGIKIRAATKSAAEMCDAIGMAAVVIPWGDVVPALASGRIEGVTTSAVSGVDGKFWEFLKYVYPTNHSWSIDFVSINLDAWKKIAPKDQTAMVDLANTFEPKFWDTSIEEDKTTLKTLTDHGMEVVKVPPAMMNDMQKRTAPLLEDFYKRAPAAKPIVEKYLAEVGRS
jgi:TRAP-type C4-dicarboxylate transport system substrate-binding protein